MARRRNTSRVTRPGTTPSGSGGPATYSPPELPSIRKRKPVLFWTVVVATMALVVPLVAGIIQVLL